MTKKQFVFKYDPQASLKEMFEGFNKVLKTSKPDIQPKNVLVSNNLEAIYRCLTPTRLEIFTCLIEKKPNNLIKLTQLLKRDYADVWKDVQALRNLEIIKLKKVGKETQAVALYDKITFDFSLAKKRSVETSRPVSL